MAFYKTKGFKYLKNLLIGLGAAFIIIGALLKILHHPWANAVLIYAMVGEALIFAVQAFIPPDNDYYWEKLYPGLDKHGSKMEAVKSGRAVGVGTTQRLDAALSGAGVNEDLIKRLGKHLNSLGNNLSQLSDVANTTSATSEYSKQAKEAAKALSQVKVAYQNAAVVANDLATASTDTKKYHSQVQLASDNLAKLNAVYELELQDTNNHLKALNKFYSHLTSAIDNLNESVEDTNKYKHQMASLANNLTSLNTIYGNMLNAMSMGAGTTGRK